MAVELERVDGVGEQLALALDVAVVVAALPRPAGLLERRLVDREAASA